MRYVVFCLFLLLFSAKPLVAQMGTGRLLWQAKEIKMTTAAQKKGVKFLYQSPLKAEASTPNFTIVQPYPSFYLPGNYYNTRLGWVCKQEWKMEKKTSVPLRFRLGSKEQVDFLEGKNDQHVR
jgi:hypothetical protein